MDLLPRDITNITLLYHGIEEYCKICNFLSIPLDFNFYFKHHDIPKLIEICKYKYLTVDLMEFLLSKRKRSSKKIIKCMKQLMRRGHDEICMKLYRKFYSICKADNQILMNRAVEYDRPELVRSMYMAGADFTFSMIRVAIDRASVSAKSKHFEIIKYLNSYNVPIGEREREHSVKCMNKQNGYFRGSHDITTIDGFINLHENAKMAERSCEINDYLLNNTITEVIPCVCDHHILPEDTPIIDDKLKYSNILIKCVKYMHNEKMTHIITSYLSHDIKEYNILCDYLHIDSCINKYFEYRSIPNIEVLCDNYIVNIDIINYLLSINKYSDDVLISCMKKFIIHNNTTIINDWYCNKFNKLFKKMKSELMDISSGSGHIEVVKLLRSLRIKYTSSMIMNAIKNVKIKMIQYLYLNGVSIKNRDINISIDEINKTLQQFRNKTYNLHSTCDISGFTKYHKEINNLNQQCDIHNFLLKHID